MMGIEEEQETGLMESENVQRQKVSWVLSHPAPEFAKEALRAP